MGDEQEYLTNAFVRAEQMGQGWERILGAGGGTQEAELVDTTDYKSMLDNGLKLSQMNDKFDDSLISINDKIRIETELMEDLAKRGYSAVSEKMQEQVRLVDELKQGAKETAQAQVESNMAFMSSLLEQAGATEKMQLEYARASGQITDGAYEQQKAMMAIADAMASGELSAKQGARAVQALITKIGNLDGMTATAWITTIFSSIGGGPTGGSGPTGLEIGNMNEAKQEMNAAKIAAKTDKKNMGGPLGQVSIVGDGPGGAWTPYTEVIVDGYVYNAKQSKKMRDMGLFKNAKNFRVGGSLDDPTYDPGDVEVFGPTGSAIPVANYIKQQKAAGKSYSGSSPAAAVIAQSVAEAVVGPVAIGVAEAVSMSQARVISVTQQSLSENKRTNKILDQILFKVASERGIANAFRQVQFKTS